jgi:hypothetical protein
MDDATLLVWIDRGRTLSFALVAVGVVGEFLVDRVSGPIIKRRDAAQQAEIARFNKEAGDARTSAANAEARAAQVGEGTAKALAQAAAANERATKLEVEAAQQRERAAKAERDLLELQQRMAPRVISGAQEAKLLAALKPLSGKNVAVFFVTGLPETEKFARALAASLTKAGLNVQIQPGVRFGSTAEAGISLTIGKNRMADAGILADALVGAEVATVKPIPAEESKDDELLQIIVAPK